MGRARGSVDGVVLARGYQPRAYAHPHPCCGGKDAAGAQPQARAGRRGRRRAPDHSPLRRPPPARVRRASPTAESMIVPVLLLVLQANAWVATPSQPTVGDTIRLERTVAVPAGWRGRAGKIRAGTGAEQIGDAIVGPAPGAGGVRYALVAWAPGEESLGMPPPGRVGPPGA